MNLRVPRQGGAIQKKGQDVESDNDEEGENEMFGDKFASGRYADYQHVLDGESGAVQKLLKDKFERLAELEISMNRIEANQIFYAQIF